MEGDLSILFLPFLAPGHMIPMVDLAKLFAARPGVRSTVVTTDANAPLIAPAISRSLPPIHLLTLPFPSSTPTNVSLLPTPDLTPDFLSAIDSLRPHLDRLLCLHRPDCIVSDVFYPWTADLAAEHGIPRLAFHGSSAFSAVVLGVVGAHRPFEASDAFTVPEIPHRVELVRSQLPHTEPDDVILRIVAAQEKTRGTVMNTFRDLERGYAERLGGRSWLVGPVSLCNEDETAESRSRGGRGEGGYEECLKWLGGKEGGSVVYACFGSLGRFTDAQRREVAAGLGGCGRPFVWVVRDADGGGVEGIGEKGLVLRGWVPQVAILRHPAIGGFLTHCGWNSCLEGITAGLPMITWPQFSEQFMNERFLVDVLKIGVSVGAKVCSGSEEKRTLVKAEEVTKAVNEVMGDGEEAEERRKRAKGLAVMAREAMKEGGSSYAEMSRLILELRDLKKVRELGLESKNEGDV